MSSMEALITAGDARQRGDAAIPRLALRCDERAATDFNLGTHAQILSLVRNLKRQPFRLGHLAAMIEESMGADRQPSVTGDLLQVLGNKTDLVRPGDDLVQSLVRAMDRSAQVFQDGDILVVSESIVATSEGRVVNLDEVQPGDLARSLAARYKKDPTDGADPQGVGRDRGRDPGEWS